MAVCYLSYSVCLHHFCMVLLTGCAVHVQHYLPSPSLPTFCLPLCTFYYLSSSKTALNVLKLVNIENNPENNIPIWDYYKYSAISEKRDYSGQ